MLDELKCPSHEAVSGFPDHPHRGFETCSIMLSGKMEHKDSHGNHVCFFSHLAIVWRPAVMPHLFHVCLCVSPSLSCSPSSLMLVAMLQSNTSKRVFRVSLGTSLRCQNGHFTRWPHKRHGHLDMGGVSCREVVWVSDSLYVFCNRSHPPSYPGAARAAANDVASQEALGAPHSLNALAHRAHHQNRLHLLFHPDLRQSDFTFRQAVF